MKARQLRRSRLTTSQPRWTRVLSFSPGTYRFVMFYDDGVRLYVDGTLVFQNWCSDCRQTDTVDVPLTAGNHEVKMEMRENGGWAAAALSWSQLPTATPTSTPTRTITPTPTRTSTPTPTHTPTPTASCPTITAWRGEYWNNQTLNGTPALCRNDTSINFEWYEGSPAPQIQANNFSARWTRVLSFSPGTYQFVMFYDDGVRLYIDGTLVFQNWCSECRQTDTVDVPLTAGAHEVKMEMRENGGWAAASLSWSQLPTATPTSTPTPTRTPVTTSYQQFLPVIMRDNSAAGTGFDSQFNGSTDGWESHSGTWVVIVITISTTGQEGTSSSVSYAAEFSSFDYQVRLGRSGTDSDANRIMIRGTPYPLDEYNHWYSDYTFQYTTNGWYSVWKQVAGSDAIALQTWTPSPAINQGFYWNTLRVVANGSSLYFYINETLVWSGVDTDLEVGRVGIGMYRTTGNPDDRLWVDWATLTPLGAMSSAIPISDTVSLEQQTLNDASNKSPIGSVDSAPQKSH